MVTHTDKYFNVDMSLFTCTPVTRRHDNNSCLMSSLGNCKGNVSPYICNNHYRFFGLVNQLVHYTDGENETVSRVVTYACSVNNLSIPLFLDDTGKVLLNEIHSFSANVAHNFPNTNADDLSNIIACNLGLSAQEDVCKLGGWLDDVSSEVILHDVNAGEVRSTKDLPKLHRILFHYTLPSMTYNESTHSHVYFVDNIGLIRCPVTGRYKFSLLNKQNVLKYTDHPNCVATPLVLTAKHRITTGSQDRVFRQLNSRHLTC